LRVSALVSPFLCSLLGGYDAIAAFADNLLPRLQADPQLARFWQHRGEDGLKREKQHLVGFLCSSAGGPLYYTGRDMKSSHRGIQSEDRVRGVITGANDSRDVTITVTTHADGRVRVEISARGPQGGDANLATDISRAYDRRMDDEPMRKLLLALV
jgi:hypothetical protein